MAGLGRRSHYRKHLTDSVLHDLPEPQHPHERIAQIVGSRGGNFFDILVSPAQSSQSQTQLEKTLSISKENESDNEQCMGANNKCKPRLALLPTKFRKLVWVKRGDFVIVNCGDDADDTEGNTGDQNDAHDIDNPSLDNIDPCSKTSDEKKEEESKEKGVRYMIQHVLYKDQVKHLKDKGLWPDVFNDPEEDGGVALKKDRDFISKKEENIYTELDDQDDYHEEEDLDHDYLNPDDLLMNANTNRRAHLAVYDDSDEGSSSDEDTDDEEDE